MTPGGACLLAAAALAAGFVNALAGGGSLLSFPALTAVGVPAVAANVSNTLALTPGYLGASLGQGGDLAGQRQRLLRLLPAAALGGLIGARLLLCSDPALFARLVPWLLLSGSGLLAVQEPLRRQLLPRRPGPSPQGQPVELPAQPPGWGLTAAVLLASVYGGYFGAGLSVILLAVLGTGLDDSLPRLNGLKQPLSLAANLSAALHFALSGPVRWPLVLLMAAGAWLGGLLGGRWASRVDPVLLRRLVVAVGITLAAVTAASQGRP
jgi:uncharacterized membrane protein YfcA